MEQLLLGTVRPLLRRVQGLTHGSPKHNAPWHPARTQLSVHRGAYHCCSTTPAMLLPHAACDCSAAGAGDEMVAGDSVGIMPQGPGQQPMGPAQLAALLRCVPAQSHCFVVLKHGPHMCAPVQTQVHHPLLSCCLRSYCTACCHCGVAHPAVHRPRHACGLHQPMMLATLHPFAPCVALASQDTPRLLLTPCPTPMSVSPGL
jgi:hypothetical protein